MQRKEYQILAEGEYNYIIEQVHIEQAKFDPKFIYFVDEQIRERIMQMKGAILNILLAGKKIKLDDILYELEKE